MVTLLVSGKHAYEQGAIWALANILLVKQTLGFEFCSAHLHRDALAFSVHQADHSDAEHSDPGPFR